MKLLANHELNKSALQNLIALANAKTNKNDITITDAIASLEAGYGQGGSTECSGEHVIQVEELPETGEEGTVYKIKEIRLIDLFMNSWGYSYVLIMEVFTGVSPTIYNVNSLDDVKEPNAMAIYYVVPEKTAYGYQDGSWSSVPEGDEYTYVLADEFVYYEWQNLGLKDVVMDGNLLSILATTSYYYVETKPVDPQVTDASNGVLHIYYVSDENDLFCYGDFDETGANSWSSLGVMLDGATFGGWVQSQAEATDESKYYAIGGKFFKKRFTPYGKITILEANKIMDVRDFETAIASITKYSGGKVYS